MSFHQTSRRLRSNPRRSHPTRPRQAHRFAVEWLEERALLTTLYYPVNGAENATNGGGALLGTVSPGMPLYTIYWGSYWATSAGQSQQSQIQNSLDPIFYNSSYLSGLNQYGVPYPAFIPNTPVNEVNNYSDPSNGFTGSDIQGVISYAISNQGLPDSNTYTNAGLYLVFTPPGIASNSSGAGGYHTYYTGNNNVRDYAWIGDVNSQGLNDYTYVTSHEVEEAMTDPHGDAWQVNPRNSSAWNEICDNEAQNYTEFLNGYEVQSHWSQSDGEYSITDGNSQTLYEDAGGLYVYGDQLGSNYNDTVTVNQNSSGGVLVTLNGQQFSYPSGEINQIYVFPGGGSDTINVESTSSSAPVTIDEGSGSDSVFVSPTAQFLDHIQGNVTVNGGSGYDTLTIDDQADPFNDTYTMTGSSLTRTASALIGYNLMNVVTVNGGSSTAATYNVQNTESYFTTDLNTGSGGNTVNVLATTGTLNVTSAGNDTINVGNAGSVQGILGTLNVEDPPSFATLNVNDSADATARTVTLGTFTPSGDTPWGSISGLAPASINYEQADLFSPVTIDGGSGGNTFNIVTLPIETVNLNTGAGNDTVNVQATAGSLVVNGQGGTNKLVGPNVTETWTISGANAGSVGVTTFSNLQNLTGGTLNDTFKFTAAGSVSGKVNGGTGTNTLDYSGDGGIAATVNLATLAATKTGGFANIQSLVGSSAADTLIGPNVANTWILSGVNAGTVGTVAFSAVENLTGGTLNDLFKFPDGGSVSGVVNGGGGTDTLGYGLRTTGVTVNLTAGTATATGGVANIQNVTGTPANDTITGNSASNVINGNGGTDVLNGGGGGSDLFILGSAQGSGTTVTGAGSSDTLQGGNVANTWTVTGANAGNVNGIAFTGIADLTGGTLNDLFRFADGGSVSGVVNGGGGTDTLGYGLRTTGVTVNLTAGTATATGGVANIQNVTGSPANDIITGNSASNVINGNGGTDVLKGGGGGSDLFILGSAQGSGTTVTGAGSSDTLQGGNVANTWTVTGANAGNVNGIAFTGIANLTGGTLNDLFKFPDGGSVSGVVNGGPAAPTRSATGCARPA